MSDPKHLIKFIVYYYYFCNGSDLKPDATFSSVWWSEFKRTSDEESGYFFSLFSAAPDSYGSVVG